MIPNTLYKHGDTWYQVKRQIPHHNIVDKQGNTHLDMIKTLQDELGCNHTLKTQTHYLICQRVEDAVYTE